MEFAISKYNFNFFSLSNNLHMIYIIKMYIINVWNLKHKYNIVDVISL